MRKRFTKDEKAAFTVGTEVEWRNGSHWHPGTVIREAGRSSDGWDSVIVTNHATTRTVSAGELIDASPTFIRLPAPPAG